MVSRSQPPPDIVSTWVLLRGLTRERRHWGEFPQRMKATLPEANVMTLDLPGNGARHRESSPPDVATMVEACRAELLRQGARLPFHLLAMSLGAMVAVEWASRYPREIAAAVLINTSLRPYSAFYQRLRPRNYAALLGHLLRAGNDDAIEAREAAILDMTSRIAAADVERRRKLVEDWSAWQRECPVAARNFLRQLWAASRYMAPPQAPTAPLLILDGAADTLVDPRCSRHLASAWQVDYAEHPIAGHDLPLDDPEWVVREVKEWFHRKGANP